ncbi:MAG: hypothetical protein M1421_05275 [Candidatus Eremiobacteraeota bacterium]|jgi:hypothetical protein|nr:hypothetical protein [Candidatus Eremiobacteraeota bacterium]MCL5055398.1 hypothetical protein [Bacillota bacterium]
MYTFDSSSDYQSAFPELSSDFLINEKVSYQENVKGESQVNLSVSNKKPVRVTLKRIFGR